MSITHFLSFLLLLISAAAAATTALTHPSDVQALKAFKAAINPNSIPSWSCLASWDFSAADPCALPRRTHFLCGVTCDSSGTRVTAITLDSIGYSGTLSPLVSRLSALTALSLPDNSFHGPIPFDSLSSLPSLQTLSLPGNSFSGGLPPSITGLKSLQDLDLSRNLLSGKTPASLSSLISLQRLDLSFNKFSGSIPKLPPNLIELTIRSNSLSGPVPQPAFSGSGRLEVIDLSANSFSGALQGWIFNLPAIQQVNLSNNTLTRVDIGRPRSGTGEALVAVDLGFNRIEGLVPVNFQFYPSLSALSLRYNRLRGPIPSEYGKKGMSIRRLFLDGNYLTGKPPAEFFSGEGVVTAGSLGDNCLERCPTSSELCLPSQKPMALCKQVYSGKPRS